jgi:ABC-type transport system substrate-binding protein
MIGDAVMVNQFEPLVRSGKFGLIEPLGAKSWEVSHDRKNIRFIIDSSRKFSDGTGLTAQDFKRSWEDGLRMQSASNNSSLADVFANLRGIGDFARDGTISGIKTSGKEILELEFTKPIRSALEHLSGLRYAAYKMSGSALIGTGPYVMTEDNKVLTLIPNKYYSDGEVALQNVRIIVLPPAEAVSRVKSGDVDMVLFAEKSDSDTCSSTVECVYGQEGTHQVITLNGLPGRFFSERNHRRAFQALMMRVFKNPPNKWTDILQTEGFVRDSQSYLPFQAGRIESEEAERMIKEGEKYIPSLLADSLKSPLLIKSGTGNDWLPVFLKEEGVAISDKSRMDLEEKDWLGMLYKTFEPDILPARASVTEVDADGLYHLLGRNGAIYSPMLGRKSVEDSLEKGRKLLDQEAIVEHYKKVSREILEEVPYVHLGYIYRKIAFNPKTVRIKPGLLNRRNYSLLSFEPN